MNKRRHRGGLNANYKQIDVPYEFKHICFYCGESADTVDHVPPVSRYYDYIGLYDKHPAITVPSCMECNLLLSDSLQEDIYGRFDEAKKRLTVKLKKYLKYASIWDENELDNASFTGDLQRFAENVMIEASVAKERLEWQHWALSIDGAELYNLDDSTWIEVGGMRFKKYDHVLEYVKKVHKVAPLYFEKVVEVVGLSKVDFALHYCKTNKPKNQDHMNILINNLKPDD